MSINIYMKARYYVYSWVNPKTNTPFYIGKGTDTRCTNYHESGRCENKRQKLLKEGYTNEQIVKIIKDNLTEEEALSLEQKLQKEYKRIEDGGTLFNYKLGGAKGFKILNPKKISLIKRLYVDERKSAKQISEIVSLHETSVLRYLRINGIQTYNRGSRFKFSQKEVNHIIELYNNKTSTLKISKMYKCSVPTILILLRKNNVTIRTKSDY